MAEGDKYLDYCNKILERRLNHGVLLLGAFLETKWQGFEFTIWTAV